MALEAAFRDLVLGLHRLQDGLSGVHTTIIEDRPLDSDVVLVDVFGDTVADLRGLLEEALTAAADARTAVAGPTDLDRTRRALAICHERFNTIAYRYATDLIAYERLAPLLRFGREHDRECRAWANSVKHGLDSCRQPIYETNGALFHCWQEIAERVGLTSLSVQNTTIGQQVAIPKVEDLARIT